MTDDADEAATDPAFRRLLDKLAAEHNFDFREYKTASRARRIRARVQRVHVDSFESYLTYLDRHTDEHGALFNTILINVQELQAANDELGALNVEMDRRRGQTKEVDEHQRAVLGSLPWPVVVLDRDGVVRTWNRAAGEIWGLDAAHVLQRPFRSVPVGDVAQKIRETLARVTATGVAEIVTKIDFTLPSSEARHLTMQVTPLRNDAGEPVGVVGVVTRNDPPA